MTQLSAADVALWMDKVDQYGGTRLDAAMNIILLDDYFDKEIFQRDKYDAAIRAIGALSHNPREFGDFADLRK